jgi:hypothetical protein
MPFSFNRPNDTSTGGAGTGGLSGLSNGAGMVATDNPPHPRNKPFPWPYPDSAQQGGVGGAGGIGMVATPKSPWSQPYHPWGPWEVYPRTWLPWNPVYDGGSGGSY